MTSPLVRILTGLEDSLRQLDEALRSLDKATATAEAATDKYAMVLAGSWDSEAEGVLSHARFAQQRIEAAAQLLRTAASQVRNYRERLGGTQPAPPQERARATTSSTSATRELPVSMTRLEDVRRTLPRSPQGAQTTGWWLQQAGGRTRILSGEDNDPEGYARKASEFVIKHFPAHLHAAVALARHTEVKMAMRMREMLTNHEVIVIDKEVCGRTPETAARRYHCDKYLPVFLPKGAILTVIEHDGSRIDYVGRGPG